MNTIDLKNTLLEELDFIDAPGFRPVVSWPNDRSIPHVSSAYFIQGNPVIYFSQFEEVDPQLWHSYTVAYGVRARHRCSMSFLVKTFWCSIAMMVRRLG